MSIITAENLLTNMNNVIKILKLFTGLIFLAASSIIQMVVLLLFLPSSILRIRSCNYYGKIVGQFIFWLTGSTLTLIGAEHLNANRPAIYVSNHNSILDIFLAMWLSPVGTVGIAKSGIIFYPFFGQLYLLSGHLRINRKSAIKSVASLKKLSKIVKNKRLSAFLWPEGTRAEDGRLIRFKTGVVLLAIETGLPVVPVVVAGTHKCWPPHTLDISAATIQVEVFPPIDTQHWSLKNKSQAINEVRNIFCDALPVNQKPAA